MKTHLPDQITFPPHVIFQALQDEAVLLDMKSEQYFALNELGMRMWQLLSENGDTVAAMEQLLQEYEIEETALRQDMAGWIGELVDLGLAHVDPDVVP